MDKLLIIKLGAIGDVLRTTAILKGLKEKHNAQIYWVTKKESYDILKNNPLIDKVLIYDGDLAYKLKNEKFGIIINLDDDYESCRLASELKSDKIIGAYQKDGKKDYTEDSAQWFDMGLISKYGKQKADKLKKLNNLAYQQHLYVILGINEGRVTLNLEKKELEFAENFAEKKKIGKDDLVIGLNTSAGKRWKLKSLGIEKTAELADGLTDSLKAKVMLFGGKDEKERNEKIIKSANSKIIDAGCENSVLEFAALLNLCDIIVASDSLALHIAIALNKKIVVFFGPTSASEIELYGFGKKVVSGINCVCCYKKECEKTPNCVDLITTEDLVNAVKSLVKK